MTIIKHLEDDDIHKIFSNTPKQSTSEILNYGMIKYIKYEYANPADQIKKILEKNKVEKILLNRDLPADGKPISLDIGCATCRYPLLVC